jgi:hypothetical protein
MIWTILSLLVLVPFHYSNLRMSNQELFPFIHPSIAKSLCFVEEDQIDKLHHIDSQSLIITVETLEDFLDTSILRELAKECQHILFHNVNPTSVEIRPLLCSFRHLSHINVAVATLLALNTLESAIRRTTGYSTGKAPPLKFMLQKIHNAKLVPILRSLLLPGSGLNLRNLLWHGFVSTLTNHWLALIIILIYNLEYDDTYSISKETNDHPYNNLSISNFLSHPSVQRLNRENPMDLTTLMQIQTWLPQSHWSLLDLAYQWKHSLPSCSMAILSILIEHGIRVEWCQVNNRLEDLIARPGSYFVTLDGHSQRKQHDLLLHPYVGLENDEQRENKLIESLGGGAYSLLTDIFISSCGGPNIRAALGHGLWDNIIEEELNKLMSEETNSSNLKPCHDMVNILFLVLRAAAIQQLTIKYQPQYSFTAKTRMSCQTVLRNLEQLELFETELHCPVTLGNDGNSNWDFLTELRVPVGTLHQSVSRLPPLMHDSVPPEEELWTIQNVWEEYHCNKQLADCAAVRALMAELAIATHSYLQQLHHIHRGANTNSFEKDTTLSSSFHQSCYTSIMSLYTFQTFVAIRCMEIRLHANPTPVKSDCVLFTKAVERSRMCLSTFQTFFLIDQERAKKAIHNFARGKAVKTIRLELEQYQALE